MYFFGKVWSNRTDVSSEWWWEDKYKLKPFIPHKTFILGEAELIAYSDAVMYIGITILPTLGIKKETHVKTGYARKKCVLLN